MERRERKRGAAAPERAAECARPGPAAAPLEPKVGPTACSTAGQGADEEDGYYSAFEPAPATLETAKRIGALVLEPASTDLEVPFTPDLKQFFTVAVHFRCRTCSPSAQRLLKNRPQHLVSYGGAHRGQRFEHMQDTICLK